MVDVMCGRVEVSVVIAFRVAKVLDTSIYDVIAGRALPDGTCQSCGKEPGEHWRCAGEPGAAVPRAAKTSLRDSRSGAST